MVRLIVHANKNLKQHTQYNDWLKHNYKQWFMCRSIDIFHVKYWSYSNKTPSYFPQNI